MITAIMFKLGYAVAALVIMMFVQWGLLAWFNKLVGFDFDHAIANIDDDPKAASIYAGLRFLGVSIMCSVLLFGCIIL